MSKTADELRAMARRFEKKAAHALALWERLDNRNPEVGIRGALIRCRVDAAARVWQLAADDLDRRARALTRVNKRSLS